MSKLLDHLKKHKNKYLSGLAAMALTGGVGTGVYKYAKHKQNLRDYSDLKASRLVSHLGGFGSAIAPHALKSAAYISRDKGAGIKLDKNRLKDLSSTLWHGVTTYRSPTETYSVKFGDKPKNNNDQLVPEDSSIGLKHSLKHQSKKEFGKFAANQLSDILINKIHNDKLFSKNNARQKKMISDIINHAIDAHSTIKAVHSTLSNSYNLGKQSRANKN